MWQIQAQMKLIFQKALNIKKQFYIEMNKAKLKEFRKNTPKKLKLIQIFASNTFVTKQSYTQKNLFEKSGVFYLISKSI